MKCAMLAEAFVSACEAGGVPKAVALDIITQIFDRAVQPLHHTGKRGPPD